MAPRRRPRYSKEQMLNAIEAVKKGVNLLTAAKRFDVPRITLRNKITGISPMVCGMGPPSILTKKQEAMFVEWMNDISNRHCPVGKEHLIDSVQHFVIQNKIDNPFTNDRPGKTWYNSFIRRHPGLSETISENFFKSKENMTEEKLESWFANMREYLQTRNLQEVLKDPHRIFTSDEAAFYLNPKHSRVFVKRNASNIYCVTGNCKENPRVFLTANAAGDLAPPMVILAEQLIFSEIDDKIPEGWGIGRTKTGWMSAISLYEYMTTIFHPWLMENEIELPIIYFLDGDATHLTYQLSEFCSKNQIEILALYPNTSQILNTMDVALFRPLRAFWKKECNVWKINKLNHPIKMENFGHIFEKALKSITPSCIRNGFKVGALFPFGHKEKDTAGKKNCLETAKIENISVPKSIDVKFLSTLENEIVVNFTQEKLDLFNIHFMNKNNIASDLPKEDRALFTIWSKYKDKCLNTAEKSDESDDDSIGTDPSLEYDISPDTKIFCKRRRRLLGSENDLSETDSSDSERLYLSLSEERKEETPTKRLLPCTNTHISQSNQNSLPVKNTRFGIKEESKKQSRVNTKRAHTIKKLREFNKRQLKVMLEQQLRLKQETLDITEKDTEKEIKIDNIEEIGAMPSESTNFDISTTLHFHTSESDAKNDASHVNDEQTDLSSMDAGKAEIENDSVIICVTNDDVTLYY